MCSSIVQNMEMCGVQSSGIGIERFLCLVESKYVDFLYYVPHAMNGIPHQPPQRE